MKKSYLFSNCLSVCGLLLSAMPIFSYAAPLDDVSLRQQGDVVLATIKLTTPVHFLRYVPGEKSRIVEIYYERVPSSDTTEAWSDREVRNSPATALTPAFTVTTRDQATQPKLVVEFANEVNFSVSAGGDNRSFVITISPEKSEVPSVGNVALPLLPTVLPPVVGKVKPAPDSPEAIQAENDQQGYKLMLAGRDALSAKNYPQATEAFNKLLMLPPNQYSQDAQEWVGVARERDGQLAKAKVEYELYLKLFTTGPGVQAVKQRLAGLASPQVKTAQSQASSKKIEPRSFVQGGISSRYYFGQSDFETTYQFNGASQTDTYAMKDQSMLITNVDAIGRYVSEDYDNRVVYRDVATQNFLPKQTNRNRVNAAYVEVKNRTTDYSARLGRQTTGGAGVMGRFDGVYAGFGSSQDLRVNGVAGQLVDFNSTTQPVFVGVSVESGPYSVYLLNQTIEGVVDRRALGGEFRYFEGKQTAYSAVDYDIFYNVLNTLTFTGSQGFESGTTVNFMADYRKNLSTRNALNGATTTSVQDLLAIMTEDRLNQLARDRTASSTYTQAGVTQRLSQTWMTGGDLRLSKITGMPASGSTALEGILYGTNDTGLEKTVTGQLIGSNLYSDADITTLGVSYFTSDYVANGQSLFVYNRTSFGQEFSLDTSWNFYRQADNYGGSMSRHIPMVRVAYQVGQSVSLDSDLGVELSTSAGSFQTTSSRRIFSSVGFRWNF